MFYSNIVRGKVKEEKSRKRTFALTTIMQIYQHKTYLNAVNHDRTEYSF
mgnify:CR=1 FL=1